MRHLLLASILAVTAAAGAQDERYYDQFDWGVATGNPGALNTAFWGGDRDGASHEPRMVVGDNPGAVRVARAQGVSRLTTTALADADYQFHAHVRMTNFSDDPEQRNAEIAFRSNGGEGYMLTLDGGQDQIRLRRQGGGFTDLVEPGLVAIDPGDEFFLRVSVEGAGPVRLRADVATDPLFTPDSLVYSVDHEETEWIQNHQLLAFIGYAGSTAYAFDMGYFSLGEVGYDHPAEAWNRTYFTDAPPPPEVLAAGALTDYEVDADGNIILRWDDGLMRVMPRVDGVVRVDVAPEGDLAWFADSFAVSREQWPTAAVDVEDVEGEPLRLHGAGWSVEVQRSPVRLSFFDGEGRQLFAESPEDPFNASEDFRSISFTLEPGEAIYGLGEHSIHQNVGLDRRGHQFPILNAHEAPSRLIFPFWLSSRGYGVFLDNPAQGNLDIGATVSDRLTWQSGAGGEVRYYVYTGNSLYEALDKHAQVTGRPALAPRWTLGNVQSRYGYQSFDEIQSIIDGFRQRSIPLDGIVIDLYWFGIETMGNLDFQQTPAWANPAQRLAGFRDQGIKTIPITEPQITGLSLNFPELEQQGLLGQHPDGGAYGFMLRWVTQNALTYLMDFTNPAAREWWKQKHEKLIVDYGFDGFWQDLNEPEAQPTDIVYTAGTGAAVGNAIAIMMNRSLDEAMKQYRPGGRTFIMSRSGYVGMQKYGASVWSGDVNASWDHLSRQPAIALGMGLAGVPYWNSDIGGFNGDPGPELYARWCQFGLFNPLYRPHAAHREREPWAFGPEAEAIATAAIRLRYRLIPYYYGVARQAYDTGAPIMRPLVMEFPDDPSVRNLSLPWLYGADLLARPIVEQGAQSLWVYFPAGTWRHLLTGATVAGPAWRELAVQPDTLLAYQRAGSILPLANVMQSSDAEPLGWVELKVLHDEDGHAAGELYEDDGLTTAYETGAFTRTAFESNQFGPVTTLRIQPVAGAFAGQVTTRAWRIELPADAPPMQVTVDGQPVAESTGVQPGWSHDAATGTLAIRLGPAPTSQQRLVTIHQQPPAAWSGWVVR